MLAQTTTTPAVPAAINRAAIYSRVSTFLQKSKGGVPD
jgi:hypothetical protein